MWNIGTVVPAQAMVKIRTKKTLCTLQEFSDFNKAKLDSTNFQNFFDGFSSESWKLMRANYNGITPMKVVTVFSHVRVRDIGKLKFKENKENTNVYATEINWGSSPYVCVKLPYNKNDSAALLEQNTNLKLHYPSRKKRHVLKHYWHPKKTCPLDIHSDPPNLDTIMKSCDVQESDRLACSYIGIIPREYWNLFPEKENMPAYDLESVSAIDYVVTSYFYFKLCKRGLSHHVN